MNLDIIILCLIIGIIIGVIITYSSVQSKLSVVKEKEIEIEEYNNNLHKINQELEEEKWRLETTCNSKTQELNKLRIQEKEVSNNLSTLRLTATQAADDYYNQALEIAQNSFDKEIDRLSEELEKARNVTQEEYLQLLEESAYNYNKEIENKQSLLNELSEQLAATRQNVTVAMEAAKRREELETKSEFYKLNISDEDLEEIGILREACRKLRNDEPINKVIYKAYYEKPYTDLIGRVIGQNIKTGIYKITNVKNDKCYVGQAVNVAERWRQHIKRGLGAETPTRNKLYPAMKSYGVENFTFELIEECSREQLNEREDYWQEYFHAKDYGYSIK